MAEPIPAPRFLGGHVRRVEDPRLIQGQARYVDDLHVPGLLHLAFVRSPHAHARIRGRDVERARQAPGVALVLTGPDLTGLSPKPMTVAPVGYRVPPHTPLAVDAARYVGQPVAAVVAAERYGARDGADLVEIDYQALPTVLDPIEALRPGAPRVHASLDSNLAFEHGYTVGDVEGAFGQAAHVVRGRFVHQRVAPLPMETRGCLARFEGGELTVWISTQMPHHVRAELAVVFGLPEHRIRVIAPEVGGGFGCKGGSTTTSWSRWPRLSAWAGRSSGSRPGARASWPRFTAGGRSTRPSWPWPPTALSWPSGSAGWPTSAPTPRRSAPARRS